MRIVIESAALAGGFDSVDGNKHMQPQSSSQFFLSIWLLSWLTIVIFILFPNHFQQLLLDKARNDLRAEQMEKAKARKEHLQRVCGTIQTDGLSDGKLDLIEVSLKIRFIPWFNQDKISYTNTDLNVKQSAPAILFGYFPLPRLKRPKCFWINTFVHKNKLISNAKLSIFGHGSTSVQLLYLTKFVA